MSLGPQNFNALADAVSSINPQFEAAPTDSALATATDSIVGIETGSNPVDLDEASVIGEVLAGSVQFLSGSSYTGGDSVQLFSGNDVTVIAPTFNVVSNPTVTVDGSLFSPSLSVVGFASTITESKLSGRSLRLKPNTKYILKLSNTSLTSIALLVFKLRLTEII